MRRHVHLVAFEKSDLLCVHAEATVLWNHNRWERNTSCKGNQDLLFAFVRKLIVYLLPSSIANPVNFLSPDHQWMPLEEFVKQPFYLEDDMSRKVIDICIKAYDDRFNGFIAHELASKLDGKLSCLYHNDCWLGENLGYQTCVWCTTENVHIIILCNMHTIWERSCISIWIMPQTKEQWYSDPKK